MKITRRELKYKGLIFDVWQEEYETEHHIFKREIVDFPETCAVLPIFNDNSAILISQYRFPLKREILEIPAGKVGQGELPEKAAAREMMEEIKMRPEKLAKIGTFYLTPGYSTENIHIFIGYDLKNAELPADVGEEIQVCRIPLQSLKEMMEMGDIEDAKTMLALMYFFTIFNQK